MTGEGIDMNKFTMNQFMKSHPAPQRKAPAGLISKDKAAHNSFRRGSEIHARMTKPSTSKKGTSMDQFSIDSFIRKVENIANKHWANVAAIARTSQEAERVYLEAGNTVQAHRRYEVVGNYYKEQASAAKSAAYDAMTTEHDKLLQKAYAEEAAPASADQLASIEAFFKTNPSEQSIVSYYERNGSNLTVAKLILSEAAKKHVLLLKPLALNVLDSRDLVERTLSRLAYGVGGVPISVHVEQLKRDLAGKSGVPTGSVSINPNGTSWSVGWE